MGRRAGPLGFSFPCCELNAMINRVPDRRARKPFRPWLIGLLALFLAGARMVVAGALDSSRLPKGLTITWRGGAGDVRWNEIANWDGGVVPGPFDVVRFDALSGDALLDPASGGVVAGVVLEPDYRGGLLLGRDLTVAGRLEIEGGKLLQGGHRLVAAELRQSGGTLSGGVAALLIEGAASVRGGLLETPRDVMRTGTLDIRAPGIVRIGENGRLEIAGDGTPLTGDGLLDTTTNRPTSVEYTGHATTDVTLARPAAGYRQIGIGGNDGDRRHGPPGGESVRAKRQPLAFGYAPETLTLNGGENELTCAVSDEAAGFAYFGTYTNPGIVVKVRLSDFTQVGALTLNEGEGYLMSAVIDPVGGFAYLGTDTWPAGKIVKSAYLISPASGRFRCTAASNSSIPRSSIRRAVSPTSVRLRRRGSL